jgi:ribulose-5-phosphate 4-epimerase/fuculose-1-phosphate aldolase
MIPYHPSGSHSLHLAVEDKATDFHVLLLRQHGLLVAGTNMAESLGIVEEVEQCCQIGVASGTKGGWLTEAQCQEIDQALGRSWKD